jgi:alanyl-tRNA synthetase
VQAGYLARLVIRKVLRLIDGLGASITLEDVIRKQIQYQSAFPWYKDKQEMIVDMVQRETQKYASTIDKGKRLVRSIAERHKGKDLPINELVKLYDSHGIPPEIVASVSGNVGTHVAVPDNFYSLVAETHEQAVTQSKEDHESILKLPATYKLYYDEPELVTFQAQVIGIVDNAVILDKTLFYPGGGGQPEDTGYIEAPPGTRVRVTEARLIDQVIMHEVSDISSFSVGQKVIGEIDPQRRLSLARHHTATHILLASIKQVLGEHIWQEGAQKGVGASRLDVSHYKKVTDEERRRIERIANETVMSDIQVEAKWMDRNEAEQTYGFTLYQGGVPPGAVIRVVKVGTDVQACAGTHMTSAGKVGPLRIIRTERIQDGVERFEFAAGIAAIRYDQGRDSIASECSKTLRVPPEQLPATVSRFFEEWKERGKENEDLKKLSARFFSLLAEHQAVKEAREALTARDFDKLESALSSLDSAFETVTSSLPAGKEAHSVREIAFGKETVTVSTWRIDADIKELTYTAQRLVKDNSVIVLGGVTAGQAHITVAVSKNLVERGLNAATIVKEACSMLGGGGGGKPDRAQGGGPRVENVNSAINAASKLIVARLGKLEHGG